MCHFFPPTLLRVLSIFVPIGLLCPDWTPHLGVPPVEVGYSEANDKTRLWYPGADIVGLVGYSTEEKRISVQWVHLPSEATLRQEWNVSYWPTAVSANSAGNRMVIGGKRRNGNTVIERWTIQKPLVLLPQGPGSPLSLLAATVSDIEALYDDAVEGRDMVHRLFPKVSEPDAWLVQYYDSKNLYEIVDASPVTHDLVASRQVVPGVLHVPALGDAFTGVWAANHQARGFLYAFLSRQGGVDTLVLVDADRDGVLDAWLRPTDQEWVTGDWADPSQYSPP